LPRTSCTSIDDAKPSDHSASCRSGARTRLATKRCSTRRSRCPATAGSLNDPAARPAALRAEGHSRHDLPTTLRASARRDANVGLRSGVATTRSHNYTSGTTASRKASCAGPWRALWSPSNGRMENEFGVKTGEVILAHASMSRGGRPFLPSSTGRCCMADKRAVRGTSRIGTPDAGT